MEPQQTHYDTFSDWLPTLLLADMAPSRESPASPLSRYLTSLYEDMRSNPGAYAIPQAPFIDFVMSVHRSAEELERHEAVKAARM